MTCLCLLGCDTFQCFNGGSCVFGDSQGARCDCPAGVYGDKCEIVEGNLLLFEVALIKKYQQISTILEILCVPI